MLYQYVKRNNILDILKMIPFKLFVQTISQTIKRFIKTKIIHNCGDWKKRQKCEDTSILREPIKFAAVIPIYSILVIAAKSICLQSLNK